MEGLVGLLRELWPIPAASQRGTFRRLCRVAEDRTRARHSKRGWTVYPTIPERHTPFAGEVDGLHSFGKDGQETAHTGTSLH